VELGFGHRQIGLVFEEPDAAALEVVAGDAGEEDVGAVGSGAERGEQFLGAEGFGAEPDVVSHR
jgi:hypothetical protein